MHFIERSRPSCRLPPGGNRMSRDRANRLSAMRACAAGAFVFCMTAPAFGADGARASLLETFKEGIEGPGYLIILMSFGVVTLIIEHFVSIRAATIVPGPEVEQARRMIEGRQFKECIEYVKGRKSLFADILANSLRHGRHGFEAMMEAADERLNARANELFRRVEYLNILGNLGPLLGLLGTVLGMIEAFGEMKASHGAYKPEDLAGGISMALVNTFLGLGVAIAGLGFFGVCRNRVDKLTTAAHAAVLDMLEYFRPAPGSTSASGLPARVSSAERASSRAGDAARPARPTSVPPGQPLPEGM